jgi:hypothetical protein
MTRSTGRERVGHVAGRDHGVTVFDGGRPCMFDPTAEAATNSCAGCTA